MEMAFFALQMPIFDFWGQKMRKNKEPDFFSKQVAHAKRFFIEAATAKSSRVKVVCGGWEQTRPDFKIDRADFPYYSLEFVAKGCGTACLAGKEFELGPGAIFSYGPNISQQITNDPKQPMTKYFIDFMGNQAKQSLQKYVSSVGTGIRVSRPDEITRILDDLIRHGQSDSPYKSMICTTLLEYLFFRIAETTITREMKVSRAFTTYQACRQNIKDRFVELNSLGEITNSYGIDHAYLCRLFKRFDTQTPYQYLMQLKMALAAELLQQPGKLVKEVAYELNFDDPFHFSRVFKKVFGISPQSFKSLR